MNSLEIVLKRARSLGARLVRTDAFTLVAIVVTVVAGWCFVEIADEVVEGETRRLDEWVVRSFRHPGNPADPLGPPWLEEVVRDLTALGGSTVLVLVIGALLRGHVDLDRLEAAVSASEAVGQLRRLEQPPLVIADEARRDQRHGGQRA